MGSWGADMMTITDTVEPDFAGAAHHVLDTPEPVTFKVLGPLEVIRDGVDHAPTPPKVLHLLAMLVIRPGKLVQTDSITYEMWASKPPRSARKTMHTYVHHLRRWIRETGLAEDPEAVLITKAPGYLLHIEPEQLDAVVFERLYWTGRDLFRRAKFVEASRCFRTALGLWAGPPLANVQCGEVLSAYGVELTEHRLDAQRLRIEAEINGGRDRELIGELRALVATNPLDEGLHAQLIRVLGRSGRRSDAMASYHQLRTRLNQELGVEPRDELQRLHRQLLTDGEPRH